MKKIIASIILCVVAVFALAGLLSACNDEQRLPPPTDYFIFRENTYAPYGRGYSIVGTQKDLPARVEIPSSFGGLPVVSIDAGAFIGQEGIEYVKIPSTIIDISNEAFAFCSSLSEVEIEDGLRFISENAFRSCTSLSSVKLPQTLECIYEGAFRNCTSLVSIRIPENVETIVGAKINTSYYNFCGLEPPYDKVYLTEPTVLDHEVCELILWDVAPGTLTTDFETNGAFQGCTSLEKVTLSRNTLAQFCSFLGDTKAEFYYY